MFEVFTGRKMERETRQFLGNRSFSLCLFGRSVGLISLVDGHSISCWPINRLFFKPLDLVSPRTEHSDPFLTFSKFSLLFQVDSSLISSVGIFSGQRPTSERQWPVQVTTTQLEQRQTEDRFVSPGYLTEATCLLLMCYVTNGYLGLMFLTIGVGASGLMVSGWHLNHQDLSPRYASVLAGFTAVIGTTAGILSPIVAGLLSKEQVRFSLLSSDEWLDWIWIEPGGLAWCVHHCQSCSLLFFVVLFDVCIGWTSNLVERRTTRRKDSIGLGQIRSSSSSSPIIRTSPGEIKKRICSSRSTDTDIWRFCSDPRFFSFSSEWIWADVTGVIHLTNEERHSSSSSSSSVWSREKDERSPISSEECQAIWRKAQGMVWVNPPLILFSERRIHLTSILEIQRGNWFRNDEEQKREMSKGKPVFKSIRKDRERERIHQWFQLLSFAGFLRWISN